MSKQIEALNLLINEMEYVLSCINEDKVPFDGDDFHEALRLGKEVLAQAEQEPVGFTVMQKPWVGLTDDEIKKIAKKHRWHESNVEAHLMPVYKALEAKLKEKTNHE